MKILCTHFIAIWCQNFIRCAVYKIIYIRSGYNMYKDFTIEILLPYISLIKALIVRQILVLFIHISTGFYIQYTKIRMDKPIRLYRVF